MSEDLAVDRTVNTEGSEKEVPKAKKKGKQVKERRVTSKKRGFLKKGEDILEVSVHAKGGDIRRGPNALEDSDNRFVWCSALLKIPIKNLWVEYRECRNYKPPKYTCDEYEKKSNDIKNRYDDILCMDATRVKLKARNPKDDYIHANWIVMPDNQKYICTQAPLSETVEDFWHMIFTEKSNVIVMLCNFVEGGHEKCYQYFVNELNENTVFGIFTVTVREFCEDDPTGTLQHKVIEVEVLFDAPYKLRPELTVPSPCQCGAKTLTDLSRAWVQALHWQNTGTARHSRVDTICSKRQQPANIVESSYANLDKYAISRPLPFDTRGHTLQVHHIAILDWPDHTAPLNPLPVVTMLKLARMLCEGRPITVHCSAGIGRTGAFVGIDYASQKIRKDGKTKITNVLKDLRHQRLQAIQSPIQYTFLHICILEMFVEEGVVAREGAVLDYYEAYEDMIEKYRKAYAKKQKQAEG